MNQLEHGYSVSETEDEKGGLLSGIGEQDIISLKSGLSLVGQPLNAHAFKHANNHHDADLMQRGRS